MKARSRPAGARTGAGRRAIDQGLEQRDVGKLDGVPNMKLAKKLRRHRSAYPLADRRRRWRRRRQAGHAERVRRDHPEGFSRDCCPDDVEHRVEPHAWLSRTVRARAGLQQDLGRAEVAQHRLPLGLPGHGNDPHAVRGGNVRGGLAQRHVAPRTSRVWPALSIKIAMKAGPRRRIGFWGSRQARPRTLQSSRGTTLAAGTRVHSA